MTIRGPTELAGIVLKSDAGMDGTLERKLNLSAVVIISLSAMLGSGLFVLPALAMLQMGGGDQPGRRRMVSLPSGCRNRIACCYFEI